MSDIEVTTSHLLLLALAFATGYIAALLLERATYLQEHVDEHLHRAREEPAPAAKG